ncbi:MAG TPA: hypothetical protein VFZ16_14385 [Hyphomicrobiaceae bacterium]|nr:hypothetical protein [Hyphomicrobiaceae bacterium]
MTRDACKWVMAGALMWSAMTGATAANAAGIGWEKQGALQACLDAEIKRWLDARVELVVNEDPTAGDINDAKVAQWATQALKGCTAKAGGAADASSEQHFMKYMAHWREHIFNAANEIRRRGRPD